MMLPGKHLTRLPSFSVWHTQAGRRSPKMQQKVTHSMSIFQEPGLMKIPLISVSVV